jgi:kynureninase
MASHALQPFDSVTVPTRIELAALDAMDPLRGYRDRFALPEGVIYLDGNSLGPLPKAVKARLAQVIEAQWGRDLIKSWNAHGWVNLPQTVGDKIARLIDAEAGEVIVADSTSINLFKLLTGALPLRPDRRVIVSDTENFPTDLYIAQGLMDLLAGQYELRCVKMQELPAAIDEATALVMLTEVDYRSGARYDMAAITALAHTHGALMLWDLAHSAGAFSVELNGCNVDLAVGCGYKYLNGGPGAPAFLFVARRHQQAMRPVLSGWFGHAEPFEFNPNYTPAGDLRRMLCGTPPVLSLAALDCALDVYAGLNLEEVRRKSLALGKTFIDLVEHYCAGFGLTLVSPREAAERGSQVCFSHPHAYPVMQALIERGVIGDFRAPNILRFGLAPLYQRYVDVCDAVVRFKEVLASEAWRDPRYDRRNGVT